MLGWLGRTCQEGRLCPLLGYERSAASALRRARQQRDDQHEDHRRVAAGTQGRVRARCRLDPPLRRQLYLAAAQHPCLQRRSELSTRHHRHSRRRSRKRTYAYVLRSMRSLRFLLTTRAGRLTRIGGRYVLRLARNPATGALYARIRHALAACLDTPSIWARCPDPPARALAAVASSTSDFACPGHKPVPVEKVIRAGDAFRLGSEKVRSTTSFSLLSEYAKNNAGLTSKAGVDVTHCLKVSIA
jgi:hypothetical protein